MKRFVLPILIAVPIVAAVVWVGWFSPWLAVEQVQVDIGEAPAIAGPLTAEEIMAAADVPMGTPMLRVSVGEVAERVEQLPAVAAVEVGRSWPTTLVITVSRRQPVAQVASGAGDYDVVDAEGVVIRRVTMVEDGVPVIEGAGEGATEAIVVARELPGWLREKVESITAGTRNDVRLILRNGSTVYWGSASDPVLKADVLKVLLDVKAAYYDVSAPGSPATSDMPARPTLAPSTVASPTPSEPTSSASP